MIGAFADRKGSEKPYQEALASGRVQMPSRRVSYVIPAPTHPLPRLSLPSLDIPRNGQTGPLLIPLQDPTTPVQGHKSPPTSPLPSATARSAARAHPQHRLGVASLALDTSTQLAGRPGPEGILYSGGRDGLVIAWELGISMKKRTTRYGKGSDSRTRWDVLTGWGDDDQDEDDESEDQSPIPYEHRWETDLNVFQAGKASTTVHEDFSFPRLILDFSPRPSASRSNRIPTG